jgi:6-phospho-beta-glucosidase
MSVVILLLKLPDCVPHGSLKDEGRNMKVSVIGGGSTYTPELVSGFLDRVHEFPLEELSLMDIDKHRLQIVGGFAQRMVQANGSPFNIVLTTDQRESVAESSYVITQLRVGQMQARRTDEYLGQRHGLIGQETTGVGGMAKALRTIPVILEIANEMRVFAKPGALLVNFTNPAGLITQALHQYAPDVGSVGVCNVPVTAQMEILELVEGSPGERIDPKRTELDTLGLNHLSWHRGFTVDGEDIWPRVIEAYLAEAKSDPHSEWDPDTIEVLRMLPNYYLQFYYYTDRKLIDQENWPPSRAEEVMGVEDDLLRKYADSGMQEPPEDLMKRGGAYYSTVATQLLNAHFNNLDETHVVNVANNGAVQDWPADWVLELPARVSREGIEPLPTKPLPPVCSGLVSQVKSYELLTVEAAVHGDRKAAYQALLAHPLGPQADKVQAVLDNMLESHREYLPKFWEGQG